MESEKYLDEDSSVDFKGVTLRISQDAYKSQTSISHDSNDDILSKLHLTHESNSSEKSTSESSYLKSGVWSGVDVISPITALPKKISETVWGTKSSIDSEPKPENVEKTRSDVMVTKPYNKENPRDFFTFRDGLVDNAVKESIRDLLKEKDGSIVGSWLLTEISLWDSEKERLIILTENSIITVKYDFIALRILDYRKVPLSRIDTLVTGALIYPSTSLVPERGMRGVRLMWNKGEPISFTKMWNPFSQDIPFNTYSSHPLYWHKECNENVRKTYDVDDLANSLIDAIERAQSKDADYVTLFKVQHKPIILQNYVSLGSLIHNKNALGFFKVRGKFSF